MQKVLITKEDGRKEPFAKKKLFDSLIRAKVDQRLAHEVVNEIARKVSSKTTTEDIRTKTFSTLCDKHLALGQLYNLRIALSEIPPKVFEYYIKKLLGADGYTTEWERIVRGAATSHEVDVTAKKADNWYLIECKHRRNFRKFSGLGKVLQVQARFEDIIDGFEKGLNHYQFTRAWVINNAKFSNHAKEYAHAKGIWLTGWGYPKNLGLAEWIQHLELYPITLLKCDHKIKNIFYTHRLLTFQDIEDIPVNIRTIIKESVYKNLLRQIAAIRQC